MRQHWEGGGSLRIGIANYNELAQKDVEHIQHMLQYELNYYYIQHTLFHLSVRTLEVARDNEIRFHGLPANSLARRNLVNFH